ncbi:ensconsin isoform X5 [Octopus bimaculoides]|uniref:ensconsin isoform X5 n=1 Tax=Octopus bimaculoides TaxID=37653 RepID=UPI00071D2B86|nr:ensconsin isoform X5 [Octopus bimaculoides]|eukprot:XP_014777293.1 PREDICTED: trichohyalin-like isoform X5 [Octopus bimaculoides]
MADTVGLLKREHADSDRGSSDTAEDGPVEDDRRSHNLDSRLLIGHFYEPNSNSIAYSDLSGTGDTQSIDTTNTSLSTSTSSSSPNHCRLDGSNISARNRYLAGNGLGAQPMVEEFSRSCNNDTSDLDGSYVKRVGRLPGQPFPTGPSWWIGYPSTVRKEKEREREERVRVAREKLADERKKKIEELKEQQRLAQEHRERQQELRRRKIDELRRREEERRAAVEERRRRQEEDQRVRREAILQRAQERVARYEQWKQSGRHRGGRIYGFGSRTPRDICLPLDRKRSSSHSTLLRCSANDSDSDTYVRPQRRAVSACSMVRRHCCVDVKSSALNTIPEKRRSFLATVTPHRTKSTTGLHMSSPSASAPVKPREMRTPRKPRPASLAGTLPGFVPLEVPKASTPRSKSSERISKDKLRNRSSTIDSAKSDKSVSSTASTQSKSSRKAIFDRLSTPKKPTDTPPKSTEKKSSAPNSGTTTPTPRKPKSTKDKGPRESPNREGTPTPSAPEDQMTRSTQDITEEEYKIKLAEKRRQAREKAEREAELERQRQEELRRQEEERIRLEEEEQRRLEEESIRLAAEGRLAEEERLRKAIEAEEQRKKEEADRLELERKQKEEAEKKAKEEADRLEKERVERAKKEEEERLARKKRLEMIMKRVKTEPNVVDTVKVESSTKSAQSSPSRSSNSSTELSPDERQEEASTTLVANDMKKASSQEDMQNIEEERTAAKFKSPLLKQLMDKRSDDSSGDTSAKFKSPILQNILGKSKTNLGNRLLKTNSSEKLASSQESLDQPFAEDSTSLKDISRQKNDVDTNAEVNPAENSLVDKDKSQNRLSVSFDQSVGMDDSGFADSNGSTKTPQIVDVNGTGRSVELSSESAIGSLVDNNLDNKDKVELTTISGESSWSTTPKQSPISHLNKPLSGITVASDCDSLARSSENQIGTLIDLSVTNKNIDLKSQQLQDNLLNNTDDLLNFNSVNSATGDHKNTLLPFEDNAPQRQDVSELI